MVGACRGSAPTQALQLRCAPAACLFQVNAVATFNILNSEGRKVVGAMLPLGAP